MRPNREFKSPVGWTPPIISTSLERVEGSVREVIGMGNK